MRRATRRIRSALATEVPPNFMTTRGCDIGADCTAPRTRGRTRGRGALPLRPPILSRPCPGDPPVGPRRPMPYHRAVRARRQEPAPAMCFDLDSRPPIEPIAGGAVDARSSCFAPATAGASPGCSRGPRRRREPAIIVLPDVRGLHPYYEELALRFAEAGVDALAIDYFGRTAGIGIRERPTDFDFMAHVGETRFSDLLVGHRGGGGAPSRARSRPRTGDLHDRLLLRRAARLPGQHAGARAGRLDRLLRLAGRARAGTSRPRPIRPG